MTSSIKRLYAKYCRHMGGILHDHLMLEDEFVSMAAPLLADMKHLEVSDGISQGFLFYREWDDERHHVEVPIFGYDADNRKTAVQLFQKLANETVKSHTCDFSVNLYRDDTVSVQAYSMLQFGIMSEVGIRRADPLRIPASPWEIRSLTKPEIHADWHRLWDATSQIIRHLKKSPVFYPGSEFTEKVYRDFNMDVATELIAAYDQGRLAGIIEWNREKTACYPRLIHLLTQGRSLSIPIIAEQGLPGNYFNSLKMRSLMRAIHGCGCSTAQPIRMPAVSGTNIS